MQKFNFSRIRFCLVQKGMNTRRILPVCQLFSGGKVDIFDWKFPGKKLRERSTYSSVQNCDQKWKEKASTGNPFRITFLREKNEECPPCKRQVIRANRWTRSATRYLVLCTWRRDT